MNQRTIMVIVIGVFIIYVIYTLISKKANAKFLMTDESMNRLVVEKAQAEGITFGQALDEMAGKITY